MFKSGSLFLAPSKALAKSACVGKTEGPVEKGTCLSPWLRPVEASGSGTFRASQKVWSPVQRAGGSPALSNPRKSKERLSLAGSSKYFITNIRPGLEFYQKLVTLGRSLEGLN